MGEPWRFDHPNSLGEQQLVEKKHLLYMQTLLKLGRMQNGYTIAGKWSLVIGFTVDACP
jgi:hypothetical protein